MIARQSRRQQASPRQRGALCEKCAGACDDALSLHDTQNAGQVIHLFQLTKRCAVQAEPGARCGCDIKSCPLLKRLQAAAASASDF